MERNITDFGSVCNTNVVLRQFSKNWPINTTFFKITNLNDTNNIWCCVMERQKFKISELLFQSLVSSQGQIFPMLNIY